MIPILGLGICGREEFRMENDYPVFGSVLYVELYADTSADAPADTV